jgi:hypothetical protein
MDRYGFPTCSFLKCIQLTGRHYFGTTNAIIGAIIVAITGAISAKSSKIENCQHWFSGRRLTFRLRRLSKYRHAI